MSIMHDMSAGGRLMALLETCEMYQRRGDFVRFDRLYELIDQTRRAVDSAIREEQSRKQLQPPPVMQPQPESPV